jgi:hypothetical protein
MLLELPRNYLHGPIGELIGLLLDNKLLYPDLNQLNQSEIEYTIQSHE